MPKEESQKKIFVGGYLPAELRAKLVDVARKETRGNRTAALELLLERGLALTDAKTKTTR